MLRGRCVFACGPIPRRLYSTLHISSQRQANRAFPSLVPVSALLGSSTVGVTGKSSFLALQQATEMSNTIGGNESSLVAELSEDVRMLVSMISTTGPFGALTLRWLGSAAQVKCICSLGRSMK